MRAFVTGGTGFVGSHLVDALLARGHDVVCLARDPAAAERLFGARPPVVVHGDLSERATLLAGCDGADVVFHAAGVTGAARRRDFLKINVEGTERLLSAARRGGRSLRFVHLSSLAAAGPSQLGRPRREDDTPAPVGVYGASKLAAEELIRNSSLPWVIVRPPTVYGPRDDQLLRTFRMARLGVLPLPGSAYQELSLVHVADLAEALMAIAARDIHGSTFFVAHPEIVTAGALARRIHATLGRRRTPILLPMPAWAVRWGAGLTGAVARMRGRSTPLSSQRVDELMAPAWTCSPRALERETGWRARIALEEGLEITARWYLERGWLRGG